MKQHNERRDEKCMMSGKEQDIAMISVFALIVVEQSQLQ